MQILPRCLGVFLLSTVSCRAMQKCMRASKLTRFFFGVSRKADFFGDLNDVAHAESRVRRLTGYVLCFVIISLAALALFLNHYEGNKLVMPPLTLVAVAAIAAGLWLRLDRNAIFGPMMLLLGALALLGGHLLLVSGAPEGQSLYWFLIFPSMVMFGLGFQLGTVFFSIFYFFLLLVMASPLYLFLTEPLPLSARVRFLAAMLGAFVFSWCAEFIRNKTQTALGRTMERLEQESMTDPLTGLGNRRDFERYFKWTVLSSSPRERPYIVAIIDIDHFKRVNDAHGHEVGDKVLRHIAQVVGDPIRFSDRLFRWGGEEFLVLMPRTSITDARNAMERIRHTVAAVPYKEDGLTLSVTVSIGFCAGDAETPLAQVIDCADQNLYAAKSGGRNRVVG